MIEMLDTTAHTGYDIDAIEVLEELVGEELNVLESDGPIPKELMGYDTELGTLDTTTLIVKLTSVDKNEGTVTFEINVIGTVTAPVDEFIEKLT